jgi:hypothetical protein
LDHPNGKPPIILDDRVRESRLQFRLLSTDWIIGSFISMYRMIQTMATIHERDKLSKAAVKPAGKSLTEGKDCTQTERVTPGGLQTKLRSLRDELREAITGIEEKVPGALIERDLVTLDSVAEALGRMMEPEAEYVEPMCNVSVGH